MSAFLITLKQGSLGKWQKEWQNTQNWPEKRNKYFPTINERLIIHITLTIDITGMLTGHGELNAYYHNSK